MDAVIEAELIDGDSGDRLEVFFDQNQYEDSSNIEQQESIKLIFKHYGKRVTYKLVVSHKT